MASYPTPTPVVEPGRLYCDFGTFGTACLDAATGRVLWKRQLPLDHHHGPGSSPILYQNLLILVRDGRDQQYVTALNKQTGETVWKTDRPPMNTPIPEFRKSFSTPLVFEADGRTRMVVPGAQWLVAYEPDTGKEIWRVDDGKGETVVLQANKDLTQLAENQLDGPIVASPALVDSAIYLRMDSHLYCLSAQPGRKAD